jgi:tetratricopeptide (TPR) repeat protein
LGLAHYRQVLSRCSRGDLAGADKYFTAGLKYFNDPGYRQALPASAVIPFGFATPNAWLLGRADVARERESQMIAAVNGNNPYEAAFSAIFSANLRLLMREHQQAEALAMRALEVSEKNQFPFLAAYSRCILGHARAELGGADAGVILIRRAIAGVLEIGARGNIGRFTASLAVAQALEGAIVDALETVEQALQANPDGLTFRPEYLRLRGELWLKQGQTEQAEAGFRAAIALAQKIGAKAWELRASMNLADMLAKQGRRDEARTMLAEIYGWFTEGFDTADLKDAKALLDGLGR